MKIRHSKLILYIATSQDGFIADTNGQVDWLPQPQDDRELEIIGYTQLMGRIDTIIMGSRSYEQILTFGDWAWHDKHTYVFTSRNIQNLLSCVTLVHEAPLEFMQTMRGHLNNKDIWLLGGAELSQSFAEAHLIDEIILTIIPKSLGDGIPLGIPLSNFDLRNEKQLMGGMVQRIYTKKE